MVKKVLTIIIQNITQVTYFLIKFLNFITIIFRNFSTILYIVKKLSMLFVPNIDNFLTIFLLSPKLLYLSTLSTLLHHHPSRNPQKHLKTPYFSTKSRTSFKMPKNPPYLLPDHTHSKHPKQKESLENKGFLLLRSISISYPTEHHFIKSYFNYFILQILL